MVKYYVQNTLKHYQPKILYNIVEKYSQYKSDALWDLCIIQHDILNDCYNSRNCNCSFTELWPITQTRWDAVDPYLDRPDLLFTIVSFICSGHNETGICEFWSGIEEQNQNRYLNRSRYIIIIEIDVESCEKACQIRH